MTHDRDLDRLLDAWFADGPSEPPDRVIDDLADRIHRQPQRPAWRLVPRETPVHAYLKPLLAVAAVVAIAVAGLLVLRQPGGVAAPVPTPTQAPTPVPTRSATPAPASSPTSVAITCDDGTTTACGGLLRAGTVSSVTFEPGVTMTLPDGWTNSLDTARTYSLYPASHSFDLQLLSHLAIPVQNADCTAAAKPGAGNTVADWVDFITTHPGLVAGTPEPVTVGGHDGQRVQFRVAPDWTERCPDSLGPAVVMFTDDGTPPKRSIWFDDHLVTAWILDVAGETVIVHVDSAPTVTANDADVRAVQPILDSMAIRPSS